MIAFLVGLYLIVVWRFWCVVVPALALKSLWSSSCAYPPNPPMKGQSISDVISNTQNSCATGAWRQSSSTAGWVSGRPPAVWLPRHKNSVATSSKSASNSKNPMSKRKIATDTRSGVIVSRRR